MNFSPTFKQLMVQLAISAALLLAAFLWLRHVTNGAVDIVASKPLPANVKERVTFNDTKHVVSVTTAKGTTASYGRNPTVEIGIDGTVKVNSSTWGVEADPFLGIGYQSASRIYLGLNGFYYRRADAFAAVGFPFRGDHSIAPLVGVSYNFWRNSAVGIGLNPFNAILREKPEFGVLLTVKL